MSELDNEIGRTRAALAMARMPAQKTALRFRLKKLRRAKKQIRDRFMDYPAHPSFDLEEDHEAD